MNHENALRRTIRFIWVPEMAGSICYAATHPEIVSRMVAGLNFDMVGQYLNKNNSTFFLNLTPHSRPHYVNDVFINLTEYLAAGNVEAPGNTAYEVFNFMDGKNSLLDIRNAVSAEFEPFPLIWVEEFADVLAKAGIIKK